jgi:putative ABC transport system permease protein
MKSVRIAIRNLSRQKKRSFLLGGAIAFGILIITLVTSLSSGFMVNVQENFSSILAGHIFIAGYEKTSSGLLASVIRDDRELLDAIMNTQGVAVRSIARRSEMSGNLIFEGESVFQSVTGVDWSEETELAGRLALRAGSMEDFLANPSGLVLNEKVAARLKAEVGDALLVQLRTITGQQNVGEFVLEATTVDTGILSTISAYAHRDHVNQLINITPSDYTQLCIAVRNLVSVDATAELVFAALQQRVDVLPRVPLTGTADELQRQQRQLQESTWEGSKYRLVTINDYLGSVQQIIQVLNSIATVVLLILFVIIMVGILNTFRMIVYERTREIGTMRALGMQRGGVRGLFLLEALFLSLGGVVLGLAVFALAAGVLSAIRFPTGGAFAIFLNNGRLAVRPEPVLLAGYLLGVALITVLAALVPAVRAARMEPARSLRTTY